MLANAHGASDGSPNQTRGNDDAQVVAGRAGGWGDDEGDVYLFHLVFPSLVPQMLSKQGGGTPREERRDAQREPWADASIRTRSQKQWSLSTRHMGVRLQG